ncbi:alpha/beta fold hydrolase [Alkalihalobacterium chitinilyticum]|uniref:Alpha/beta hydrolase n=1 Tax=Alkalihalobacterium chitinilyticum TaxID=2980103 RepID=A0ABT5VP62_9BACI|nr:alpha/beta hydrolase [Alkalihalobacterium chitinilyticum]MDE5416263.1 alpha/beta hydrolase [Alkalihalobacterium chitinilyticum]
MLNHYEKFKVHTNGVTINGVKGGSGPPLLLLHGYPQTHVMWHKVIDQLADRFTVVATDLRGYGDSSKPKGNSDHSNYSKRVMAEDQVEVMRELGFDEFYLVGHDRGARVGYRLALDHPERVKKFVALDVVPTLLMYEKTDMIFARYYYHWFFLIQVAPYPEELISQDPSYFLETNLIKLARYQSISESPFSMEAYEEYLRCFQIPNAIHAMCEDYRAGASIDLVHERDDLAANRQIECETLVLWGENGVVDKCFEPLEEWKKFANNVKGKSLPCGHFIPEEVPELLLEELFAFL